MDKNKKITTIITIIIVIAITTEISVKLSEYLNSRPIELDYELEGCDGSMKIGTHCLEDNNHVIIGPENLLLAESDEEEKYYWQDAKDICESKGQGWILPSKEQMEIIYDQRKELNSNFCHPLRNYCAYWTSTEDGMDAYITKRGSSLHPKGSLYKVRCVKEVS